MPDEEISAIYERFKARAREKTAEEIEEIEDFIFDEDQEYKRIVAITDRLKKQIEENE